MGSPYDNDGQQSALSSATSHSIADFSKASLTSGGPHRSPQHVPAHSYYHHDYSGSDSAGNMLRISADRVTSSADGPTGMPSLSATGPNTRAVLKEQNAALRQELAGLSAKLAQLQRFERDLDSIREQHDNLQVSTDKRERLEQAFRANREEKCRRLEQINKKLRARLEDARRQTDSPVMHARHGMLEELSHRDRTIHTLTAHCTRGQEECERLRRQVAQLSDQAKVIPQLESRVSENEAQLKQMLEETARQQLKGSSIREFESAMLELRDVNVKQDELERQQREQLESEVMLLTWQVQRSKLSASQDDLSLAELSGGVTARQVRDFEELLCKREKRIQQLQEEIEKWRQLYREELNVTINAKGTGLSELTRSLADLTDEVGLDHGMDMTRVDLFIANGRVIELESAVKQLRHVMSDLQIEIATARKGLEQSSSGREAVAVEVVHVNDLSPSLSSPLSRPLSAESKSGASFGSEEHL